MTFSIARHPKMPKLSIKMTPQELLGIFQSLIHAVPANTQQIYLGVGKTSWASNLDLTILPESVQISIWGEPDDIVEGIETVHTIDADAHLASEKFFLVLGAEWNLLFVAQPSGDSTFDTILTPELAVIAGIAKTLNITASSPSVHSWHSLRATARILKRLVPLIDNPQHFVKMDKAIGMPLGMMWAMTTIASQRWNIPLRAMSSVYNQSQMTIYTYDASTQAVNLVVSTYAQPSTLSQEELTLVSSAMNDRQMQEIQTVAGMVTVYPLIIRGHDWGCIVLDHDEPTTDSQHIQLSIMSAVLVDVMETFEGEAIEVFNLAPLPEYEIEISGSADDNFVVDSDDFELDLQNAEEWLDAEYAAIEQSDVYWPELDEFEQTFIGESVNDALDTPVAPSDIESELNLDNFDLDDLDIPFDLEDSLEDMDSPNVGFVGRLITDDEVGSPSFDPLENEDILQLPNLDMPSHPEEDTVWQSQMPQPSTNNVPIHLEIFDESASHDTPIHTNDIHTSPTHEAFGEQDIVDIEDVWADIPDLASYEKIGSQAADADSHTEPTVPDLPTGWDTNATDALADLDAFALEDIPIDATNFNEMDDVPQTPVDMPVASHFATPQQADDVLDFPDFADEAELLSPSPESGTEVLPDWDEDEPIIRQMNDFDMDAFIADLDDTPQMSSTPATDELGTTLDTLDIPTLEELSSDVVDAIPMDDIVSVPDETPSLEIPTLDEINATASQYMNEFPEEVETEQSLHDEQGNEDRVEEAFERLSRYEFSDEDFDLTASVGGLTTNYDPTREDQLPAMLTADGQTTDNGDDSTTGVSEMLEQFAQTFEQYQHLMDLPEDDDTATLDELVSSEEEEETTSEFSDVEPVDAWVVHDYNLDTPPDFAWHRDEPTHVLDDILSMDIDEVLHQLDTVSEYQETMPDGQLDEIEEDVEDFADEVIDARLLDLNDLRSRKALPPEEEQAVSLPPAMLLRDFRVFVSRIRERVQRILPRDDAQNRAHSHLANQIMEETQATLDILNDLTRTVNLDKVDTKRFDVTTVVKDVVANRKESFASRNIHLHWKPTNDLAVIEGDRKALLLGINKLFDSLVSLLGQTGDIQIELVAEAGIAELQGEIHPVKLDSTRLEKMLRFFHDGVPQRSDLALANLIIEQHRGQLLLNLHPSESMLSFVVRFDTL